MIIEKIVLEDFLPFRGIQEIDLRPEPGRPVVIVFADNMRGKTSLLNALRWALYGKAYRHTGREIGTHQLINRESFESGKYDFSVTLEFSVGNDRYRLTRRAVPRQLVDTPRKDSDFDATLTMMMNGHPLALDQVIHEINQVAPEQISRFFLFDGELLDQYEALLVQGSDQGRLIRDSIERVLGVPALVNAREDLRLLQREALKRYQVDERQAEAIQASIDRRNELIAKAELLDDQISALADLESQTSSEVDELERELDGAERALKESAQLESVDETIRRDREALRDLQEKLVQTRGRLWEDVLAGAIQPTLNSLHEESTHLSRTASRRSSLDSQISALRSQLAQGHCSTCGQPVDHGARERIESEIVSLMRELDTLAVPRGRVSQLAAQQHALGQVRRNGSIEIAQSLEDNIADTVVGLVKLENRQSDLRNALEDQDTESLKLKRARLSALTAERTRNAAASNRAVDERDSYERQAQALQRSIEGNSVLGRHNASQRRREVYESLYGIADQAISVLRKQLKDDVQRHATSAFLKMTTQEKYGGLKINDSYGLSIVDDQGRDVTLRSAGAEQVVAMSLIDGLHKTGMGGGAVIMDTPFGRLDPKHRRNIVSYLASSSPQVVMLVHEGELTKGFVIDVVANRVSRAFELVQEGVFATRVERATLGVDL